MELGHRDGKLKVNYSDQLVTLLREVRQLSALGFIVPAKVQHTANTAQKFYRHGVILKQVGTGGEGSSRGHRGVVLRWVHREWFSVV